MLTDSLRDTTKTGNKHTKLSYDRKEYRVARAPLQGLQGNLATWSCCKHDNLKNTDPELNFTSDESKPYTMRTVHY